MAFVRKVQCPRHFLLKPGRSPWMLIDNPYIKNMPEWAIKRWGLRRKIPFVNSKGQKVRDKTSFYQPEKEASFFVHYVYDPLNFECKNICKGRCLEGIENRNATVGKRIPTAVTM